MGWQGFWQNDWRWQFLVRWNGVPYWTTSDMAPQRLLDWPNPSTQECVDCAVDARTGRFAVQYKSFPPYDFLNDSTGNGGDLLGITDDGWIKIFATQDGGHPALLYYFVGPDGWVVAGPDLTSLGWNSYVAQIQQSYPGPYNPHGQPTSAYTRYILADLLVPEALNGISLPNLAYRRAIVSEHYGTADPAASPTLERFVYAQWVGLIRWEYWAAVGPVVPGTLERAGQDFPFGYPSSIPLNPNLQLKDCRSWTNWVSGLPSHSVRVSGWPQNVVLP